MFRVLLTVFCRLREGPPFDKIVDESGAFIAELRADTIFAPCVSLFVKWKIVERENDRETALY